MFWMGLIAGLTLGGLIAILGLCANVAGAESDRKAARAKAAEEREIDEFIRRLEQHGGDVFYADPEG
jgi:hypothetical protein